MSLSGGLDTAVDDEGVLKKDMRANGEEGTTESLALAGFVDNAFLRIQPHFLTIHSHVLVKPGSCHIPSFCVHLRN